MLPLPDIAVIARPEQPVLVGQYLDGIPHRVVTADAPSPGDWPMGWLCDKPDEAHAMFRAHQRALREATGPVTLILEADAHPARQNWPQIVYRATQLLDAYEVVILHALQLNHCRNLMRTDAGSYRLPVTTRTAVGQRTFEGKWVRSSLAYLVGAVGRDRIAGAKFNGTPLDLWMANELNMAAMPAGTFSK